MKRFSLKKINRVEVREQYQVKISNRFAALRKMIADRHINRAWEKIKMLKSVINHFLMKNVQSVFIRGCRLN
jgi:hypothetical protein